MPSTLTGASVAVFVLTVLVAALVAVILQYIWRPIIFAVLVVLFLRPIHLRIKNEFAEILAALNVRSHSYHDHGWLSSSSEEDEEEEGEADMEEYNEQVRGVGRNSVLSVNQAERKVQQRPLNMISK